jgi:glycosyltransferase involved in cell wall biosynthesis
VRVAFLNLFYPPDLAPSGHLAASVAEHRAALGDRVTVITGTGTYLGGDAAGRGAGRSDPARRAPVRVLRLWTPSLGKATMVRRLGDYVAFFAQALVRALALPRQDVIVALTTPPFILAAAVAHRLVHPTTRVVLWSHDLYPDAAEAFGTIRPGGLLARVLGALHRSLLRRVDHVVAVDPAMADRIGQALPGAGPERSVIATWEPIDLFSAEPPAPWEGYDAPGLAGHPIVLHLGNLGVGHRISTIADIAERIRDTDVRFLFVGGGARFPELADEARRRGLTNVVLHDYVPKAETPRVLAGARATLLSLDDRSLGIMSPCKLNGSLAMGVPVVYMGPAGTTVDEAIGLFACGGSFRHHEVDAAAAELRGLLTDDDRHAELATNARRAFEEGFSDAAALPRVDAVLDGLVRTSAAPEVASR